MGRFGMLLCNANYSYGAGGKLCSTCKVTDDENHRINHCVKWATINWKESPTKTNFSDIYSTDNDT